MTEHTSPAASDDAAASAGSAGYGFQSPDGLRALLIRLHESGPGAWQTDREAAELMRYTAIKYRPLARKHGLDAWEVASAAFEVMLAPSTRNAGNPWAVVTRAVQITCIAEARAAGLLVSTGKVRHTGRIAGFHDAIRFAERENLTDYHPAFAVTPDNDEPEPGEDDGPVAAVLSEVVGLFVSADWDAALVADCVEHVAYRLADLSSRPRAVEVLRRDRSIPTLLDVPRRSWTSLLRIVLGHPDPKHADTPTGDGVLLRLLSGEPPESLRDDDALTDAIHAAHPDKYTAS
ncbi:exopolyphosphatase [Propioniciclava flava]|uniref:Exopolyphosphatase n=1 Tax=Propioniciclava flava TaxID=2072026 RepID=A0A4V1Q7R3_9ACTN|nr:exopolyphosphatase [Propioniciclava flava]RXW33488.1 exopolyphosphatase [Propioniciclava flava]